MWRIFQRRPKKTEPENGDSERHARREEIDQMRSEADEHRLRVLELERAILQGHHGEHPDR